MADTVVERIERLLLGQPPNDRGLLGRVEELEEELYGAAGRPGHEQGIAHKVDELYNYLRTLRLIIVILRWAIGFIGLSSLGTLLGILKLLGVL